jgi:hypothetical protein
MRGYAPDGSRCSTCSTRLTDSTYSCQSRVVQSRSLALMLAADRFLRGRLPRRQIVVDRGANRRQAQPVLADAVEQLDDEGRVGAGRQHPDAALLVCPRHVKVGGVPRGAGREQLLGKPPQVFDQRQLQHARPRPELADGQRRDALIAVQELGELVSIEPAVAVPHQLHGDGVDARLPGMLARRQRGQRAGVRARQVPADPADLGRNQMEIVEQPVARRPHEPPGADVVGERAIRASQHPHVVVEARERVARPMPRIRIDGEARRQRQRALFEPLDAEELVAQRLVGRRGAAPQEPGQEALATDCGISIRGRSTVKTQPAPGRSRTWMCP